MEEACFHVVTFDNGIDQSYIYGISTTLSVVKVLDVSIHVIAI